MSNRSSPSYPLLKLRPTYFQPAASSAPAVLMAGTLGSISVYTLLHQRSLASGGVFIASMGAAGLYSLSAKGVKNGYEDGNLGAIAASTLVLAATLPRAIRSFKLAPVLLSNAAIAVGGYYAWTVYEEEHDI